MNKTATEIITERERTHGDYRLNAFISQSLKNIIATYGAELSAVQRESAELIATKFGRLLSGDANFEEHWLDIAGYATLVVEDLRREANERAES